MNVAVVERASVFQPVSSGREVALPVTDGECEWIDPEGDDWFSWIYRELMGEQDDAKPAAAPELDHWFG
jgi:hypothetical protein